VIKDLDIATNFTDLYEQEILLMDAEFKLSINAYLSDLLYSPVRSLAQVIAFNEAHPVEVNQIVLFLSSTYFQDIYDQMMLFPVVLVLQERLKDFGQPDLIAAEKTNGIGTRERAAIQRLKEISTNGLEKLMKEHQLDAIVAPNSDASSVLAVGGYPGIAVPAGYDGQGVPFAICFGGLKGYEPRLIEIAYAFEQATKVRRPPSFKR